MCYVNMAKGTGLNYRLAVAVWPLMRKAIGIYIETIG